jgi:tetratricopeptide (TPR) repeat protein
MDKTSTSISRFGWRHGLVLLIGTLVFVLLLFADQTNLKEDNANKLGSSSVVMESGTPSGATSSNADALLSMLPPAQPSDDIAARLSALGGESDAALREGMLREIVNGFRDQGRLDLAAVYAGELADQSPETKNLIVAGALYRNAAQSPAILADSSIFRRFSDESIRYLNMVVEKEPKNEDGLLELGLAMVAARRGELAMQGIFKIREVVELNPRNTEALFHLGKFSIETGQYDKAEARFRQILEVEPVNYRAKYFLALALQSQGKTAEFQSLMTDVANQQQDAELAAMARTALQPN